MTVEVVNHYAYHYQSVWRERAYDPRIDLVWRLASLAMGSHRRNGHASFAMGEVAAILGISGQHLSNLIAEAKKLGLIDARSRARCLVVPPHAINYGPGDPLETCGYCDGKRTGRTRNKPHIRPHASRCPMRPDTVEVQPRDHSDTVTVPPNKEADMPVQDLDCIGCRIVGPAACLTHSEHWQKLRTMNATDVERLRHTTNTPVAVGV